MPEITLIYLHGFQSSGLAFKSQLLQRYVHQQCLSINIISPDLPDLPEEALHVIDQLIEQHKGTPLVLMGSSLGGFYANIFCERKGLASVIINPAIKPHRLIADFLGDNTNPQTDKDYELTQYDLEALRKCYYHSLTNKAKRLVLLEMDDEVLDAHEAIAYYQGCQIGIFPGGSHHFDHFEPLLPFITDWVLNHIKETKVV